MDEESYRRFHEEFINRNFTDEKTHGESGMMQIMSGLPRGRFLLSQLYDLEGKRVLDLCCSYGNFCGYLKTVKGMNFEYVGMDRDVYRVYVGRKYMEELKIKFSVLIEHDLENPLPYTWDYDQVWLFGWWPYGLNPKSLFGEVHTVLRNGGMFYLDDKVQYYPISEILDALLKCGFEVLHYEKLESNDREDYGIVARKI